MIKTRKCIIITDMAHMEYPDECGKLKVLIRMGSKNCDRIIGARIADIMCTLAMVSR